MSRLSSPVSLFSFFSALLLVGTVDAGQRYAVLLAGTSGYADYFGQANTCHVYHTLRNGGLPASNIIHINYDDEAYNPHNPFQGNLVNKVQGPNIYPGCEIDYRGADVTPEVFLGVLTGNKSAIREATGKDGPVLESGPNDDVFVAMSDHGGPGVFYFPGFTRVLHASDLQKALQTMHAKQMYNRMLIKIGSCHSGSMLEGLLPDNMNIYATTSTKPDEDGFICCFDNTRGTWVGTFYGCGYAYAVDAADRNTMTNGQLYQKEIVACRKYNDSVSHPQQYGNLTMANLPLSVFMGNTSGHQHYKENDDGVKFKSNDGKFRHASLLEESPDEHGKNGCTNAAPEVQAPN